MADLSSDATLRSFIDALERGEGRVEPLRIEQEKGFWLIGLREQLQGRFGVPPDFFPDPPERRRSGMRTAGSAIYQWSVCHLSERVFKCEMLLTGEHIRDKSYGSPDAFKKSAVHQFSILADLLSSTISGVGERNVHGEATLLFDADTIEQVRDSLCDIRDALGAGAVRWTAKAVKRREAAAAAQGDSGFQHFLATALEPLPKPPRKPRTS